jgi:sodium/potassium-transporting ATPase subunit alpha
MEMESREVRDIFHQTHTIRLLTELTRAELKELQWHSLQLSEVYENLGTSPSIGLKSAIISKLLSQHGPNRPSPPPSRIMHKLFMYCFGGFGTLLLIGGVLVLLAWKPLGDPPASANAALGIVLLIVFLIQALFNAWQDYSSMQVMNSIKNMLPDQCLVLRDGHQTGISALDLVPGDIVFVRLGDKIAADLRMIEVSMDLKYDRSILTGGSSSCAGRFPLLTDMLPGESKPVSATVDATEMNYLETRNIALQGTHCIGGSGIGVVVDTGDKTVFGRIAKLSSRPRKGLTPLQKEIFRFVSIIVILIIVVVIFVVVLW